MKTITNEERTYYFADNIDDMFLSRFKADEDLQHNYEALERRFGLDEEDSLVIYDSALIESGFIASFCINDLKCDLSKNCYFDPAVDPYVSGCLNKEKDIETIQKTLAAIYEKYGRIGLFKAKSFHLAQGVMDYEYLIPVDDPDNKYDLPVEHDYHVYGDEQKVFIYNNADYNPIKRTFDVISWDVFNTCSNENIKSVLFAFPALIYKNGNADNEHISDEELMLLINRIQSQLKDDSKQSLNTEDFWNIFHICSKIFLEKYQCTFPLKGKTL